MSAIFNFQSLLTVILLLICTCAYIRSLAPSLLDRNKTGLLGIFWKCARIARVGGYIMILIGREMENMRKSLLTFRDQIPCIPGFEKISDSERKSPYVAVCCIVMAFSILFTQ